MAGITYGSQIDMNVAPTEANHLVRKSDIGGYMHGVVEGTCTTNKTTVNKAVTISGYTLEAGHLLAIKFNNGHSANNLRINVNATGNKTVQLSGITPRATDGAKYENGAVVLFYYNGTNFIQIGSMQHGTGVISMTCDDAANAVTKNPYAAYTPIAMNTGDIITIKYTNGNTVSKFDILPPDGSSTALPVRLKGTAISFEVGKESMACDPGGVIMYQYDGTYFHQLGSMADSNSSKIITPTQLTNFNDAPNGRYRTVDLGITPKFINAPPDIAASGGDVNGLLVTDRFEGTYQGSQSGYVSQTFYQYGAQGFFHRDRNDTTWQPWMYYKANAATVEKGTWTPQIGAGAFSIQAGYRASFVRIDRMCFMTFVGALNRTGTTTVGLVMNGMPYVAGGMDPNMLMQPTELTISSPAAAQVWPGIVRLGDTNGQLAFFVPRTTFGNTAFSGSLAPASFNIKFLFIYPIN